MTKVSRLTVCVLSMSLLLAVLAGGSQSAQATLVNLNKVDAGWYLSDGLHLPTNHNYVAGRSDGQTMRNWVVFDLTGVSDTIVDATLSIFHPNNGFVSADPSETYSLFDVHTPTANLVAGGSGLTDIYADLGTGVVLGSIDVTAADQGFYVNLVLNADGIAYLNDNRGGTVGIGGSITSFNTTNALSREYAFDQSHIANAESHKLALNTQAVINPPTSGAVPEPATAALGMMALVGLAAACRRRN